MSKRTNKTAKPRSTNPPRAQSRRVVWRVGIVAAVLLLAAIVLRYYWPGVPSEERLTSRWLRRDGGYVDGKLAAAYLNPRPINVARVEWRRAQGALRVVIELRDVNYPGSIDTLRYNAEQDRLVGDYFQAAQGQRFGVEFFRQGK